MWNLLVFFKPKCPYCIKLRNSGTVQVLTEIWKPILEPIFIDGQENPVHDLIYKFKIKSYPTLILVQDGKEVTRIEEPTKYDAKTSIQFVAKAMNKVALIALVMPPGACGHCEALKKSRLVETIGHKLGVHTTYVRTDSKFAKWVHKAVDQEIEGYPTLVIASSKSYGLVQLPVQANGDVNLATALVRGHI